MQKKSKGQELLDKVFEHLNLLEKDYFSLSYRDNNDVKVHVILILSPLKRSNILIFSLVVNFFVKISQQ